jgi:hypothetical protein
MQKIFQRNIIRHIVVLVLTGAITSCANDSGMAGGDTDCSAAKTAGAGALLGGLLGAAIDGKEGAIKGAAAGAIVGGLGCMAMNYHSKQLRSANQVNKEYKEKHNELPDKPMVTSYSISAPKQVVRGNNVSVNSSITVVDGKQQSVDRVEEKLFIVDSDGQRKQIKSKEAKNTGMNQGGEYANSFSFTPPTGVAQGNYRLESEVYVNDKLAKTAKAPIVLAYETNKAMFVALNRN